MRELRRATVSILALLLALGAAAPAARGHGGEVLIDRAAGAYGLMLQAAPTAEEAIDYTVTLRRDGRPEEAAEVTVQVRTAPDGAWSRPYPAQRAANTYEVMLGDAGDGRWRTWAVRVTVDGPGGAAAATAEPRPQTASEGPPATLMAGTLLIALSLAVAAVIGMRRRRAEQGV